MQKNLRWGILGTSFISEVMIKAIEQSDGGEVWAVAGRTQEKANAFAQKHQIAKACGCYETVLADPEIDIVYIGLPVQLHAEWMIRCAKANKHMLCEKPFTVNAKEAQQVLEVLQASNVFCMEAQMMRCHPLVARLQSVLADKPIGPLIMATAHFSADILQLVNKEAGNTILDLGCYPVSLLRLVFGEPQSIQGQVTRDSATAMVDGAHALIEFPNNCTATVTSSSRFGLYWQFRIFGEQGYCDVSNLWSSDDGDAITIKRYDELDPQMIVVDSARDFYVDQINTVHRHINQGDRQADSPAMNWQDSLMNMRALDLWRSAVGHCFAWEQAALSLV